GGDARGRRMWGRRWGGRRQRGGGEDGRVHRSSSSSVSSSASRSYRSAGFVTGSPRSSLGTGLLAKVLGPGQVRHAERSVRVDIRSGFLTGCRYWRSTVGFGDLGWSWGWPWSGRWTLPGV